jgi:hypothetical protein
LQPEFVAFKAELVAKVTSLEDTIAFLERRRAAAFAGASNANLTKASCGRVVMTAVGATKRHATYPMRITGPFVRDLGYPAAGRCVTDLVNVELAGVARSTWNFHKSSVASVMSSVGTVLWAVESQKATGYNLLATRNRASLCRPEFHSGHGAASCRLLSNR